MPVASIFNHYNLISSAITGTFPVVLQHSREQHSDKTVMLSSQAYTKHPPMTTKQVKSLHRNGGVVLSDAGVLKVNVKSRPHLCNEIDTLLPD